jgi:hypothetical protein
MRCIRDPVEPFTITPWCPCSPSAIKIVRHEAAPEKGRHVGGGRDEGHMRNEFVQRARDKRGSLPEGQLDLGGFAHSMSNVSRHEESRDTILTRWDYTFSYRTVYVCTFG